MAGYNTFDKPKSLAKIARILAELESLPMTRDELQCLLGVSKPTMQRYVEHLRAEKRIFVAAWRQTSGQPAPVLAAGDRSDAPRPKAMDRQQRNALEWKRIKNDRDRHDRVKSMARVYAKVQRVKGTPQPWFAALMGVA